MKSHSLFILAILLAMPVYALGQGNFIYDQQSSTNPASAAGGPIIQQIVSPYGQSFTPILSSIGFIQLGFFDANQGDGLGATVIVNLRSNAINGPIFASTTPVFMPDGFGIGSGSASITNFFFTAGVVLAPGVTYYFQPVVQSGDSWGVSIAEYNYSGGSVFVNGAPVFASDYWFREGIVPEPSSSLLFLFGGGVLLYVRQAKNKKRFPS
jgi:PEP-CTERM motif